MNSLNIVLVEPEIPQNTGNIARTCAVTGAALHLVRPLGFEIDSAKLHRAGLDYWDSLDIFYYDSLSDFFRKNPGCDFFCFSSKAKKCYTEVDYPSPVFLMFGKETKGLPESCISENLDRSVRIPMKPGQRCLNLSNAAAVAVYEVLRRRNFEDMLLSGSLSEGKK